VNNSEDNAVLIGISVKEWRQSHQRQKLDTFEEDHQAFVMIVISGSDGGFGERGRE
jgi:hypothetical protein